MTGQRPDPLARAHDAQRAIGGVDDAWRLCLAIAARRRRGLPPSPGAHVRGDGLANAAGATCDARLRWRLNGEWTEAALELFELYAPLLALRPGERFACAHLGQSIDGRIATANGHSMGLSGAQNLLHLHRLRALSDAIVIGSGTALADDPRLTTRLAPGPNPVRVVLDGRGRIRPGLRVCSDGQARTLVVGPRRIATGSPDAGGGGADAGGGRACEGGSGYKGGGACTCESIGRAQRIALDGPSPQVAPTAVLDALADRGLPVVFVEGGGTTVSRFLEHHALDRLQITVSPLLLGSGRPALSLPSIDRISDGLRPPARRFALGDDLLWEFVLRA
ncbi:MAG: RibD family protein [Lautropia sp.]